MSMFYDLLMAQSKDKKEPIYCEYLESDGNQYIDLGKTIDRRIAKRTIVMHAMWTDDFSERQAMLTNTSGYFEVRQSSGLYGLGSGVISDVKASTTSFDEIKFVQTPQMAGELFVNGKKLSERSIYGSGYDGDYIFALQYPSDRASLNCKCKMASFQMYDKDDNLYMNLRPCLHPDTLEPCMYDTVKGEYHYNKGTEPFKYKLGFTKLDYIQGRTHDSKIRNQYIDTGIEDGLDIDWNIGLAFTQLSDNQLIGNNNGSNLGAYGTQIGGSGIRLPLTTQFNKQYDYKFSRKPTGRTMTVNGVSGQGSPGGAKGGNILLFGYSSTNTYPVIIYYSQIFKDSILVSDLVPARLNNGQIGMWDFIKGEFLPNLGEGNFIGYLNGYQVGESIEGTGSQYIETGFVPHSTSAMYLNFQLTDGNPGSSWFVVGGCFNPTNKQVRFQLAFNKLQNNVNFGYGAGGLLTPPVDLKQHEAIIDGYHQECIYDGKKVSGTMKKGDLDINKSDIHLFKTHQNNAGLVSAKIYTGTFAKDGILTHNLIAVKKGNFIGMLDTLTGKEYPSLGRDSFIFNE